jgi:hypothetical protein
MKNLASHPTIDQPKLGSYLSAHLFSVTIADQLGDTEYSVCGHEIYLSFLQERAGNLFAL